MKYLFLIATIALHILSLITLKLLDSFWLIIVIFILSLVYTIVALYNTFDRIIALDEYYEFEIPKNGNSQVEKLSM
jgi:hypothetical protein